MAQFGSRSFNTITVDAERGTVRKVSRHPSSLVREIDWYRELPSELRGFAPAVVAYDRDPASAFLEIELVDEPSLAELFVRDGLEPAAWRGVLNLLQRLMEAMGAHRWCDAAPSAIADAMEEMYLTKTLERLSVVVGQPQFEPLRGGPMTVNGVTVLDLDQAVAALPDVLDRSGLLDPRPFTVIHGDLCLSNVLFDATRGGLWVVDPRGDFGGAGIHGDRRYDLAKLCHSFEGGYDLLLAGRFELSRDGHSFVLDIHRTREQLAVRDLFAEWWRARWPGDVSHVKLIESLLFLSMVPLHADRPDSQIAFLARGLELFARVVLELGLGPMSRP